MASRVCLVHYHEIGLKGKNRARFERILMDNLKAALAAFSVFLHHAYLRAYTRDVFR